MAFAHYGAAGEAFTVNQAERRKAATLAGRVERTLPDPKSLVFLGRIGTPVAAKQASRSLRVPLAELVRA